MLYTEALSSAYRAIREREQTVALTTREREIVDFVDSQRPLFMTSFQHALYPLSAIC
jgi:hypothetical protein